MLAPVTEERPPSPVSGVSDLNHRPLISRKETKRFRLFLVEGLRGPRRRLLVWCARRTTDLQIVTGRRFSVFDIGLATSSTGGCPVGGSRVSGWAGGPMSDVVPHPEVPRVPQHVAVVQRRREQRPAFQFRRLPLRVVTQPQGGVPGDRRPYSPHPRQSLRPAPLRVVEVWRPHVRFRRRQTRPLFFLPCTPPSRPVSTPSWDSGAPTPGVRSGEALRGPTGPGAL